MFKTVYVTLLLLLLGMSNCANMKTTNNVITHCKTNSLLLV